MTLTDRLLALIGLDLDFSADPFSERFSRVSDTVYLGGCPMPEDVPALQAAGVTHVVTALPAAAHGELAHLREHFDWLHLHLDDTIREDISTAFEPLFGFAQQASSLRDAKLLVHCQAGVSRSAALVIALQMQRQRITFLEAFKQVRARRARVLPNIGFASKLQQLEFAVLPELAGQSDSLARYLHDHCAVPAAFNDVRAALVQHNHDALPALQSIFGRELPRVIQGAKA